MPERKYSVVISKSVQKTLSKLPDRVASKLESSMLKLENGPRPFGYKKLKGRDAYRIREGDYRIIYEVKDNILLVIILDVGNRKNIYE